MIEIERSDVFARLHAEDPTALGQLTARLHERGYACNAIIRPDLTPEQNDDFRAWVERTLAQLSETGDPMANGWFASDYVADQWYLIAHHRDLPVEP